MTTIDFKKTLDSYRARAGGLRLLDVVPPLEGLWWAEDMDDFTVTRDKSRWE